MSTIMKKETNVVNKRIGTKIVKAISKKKGTSVPNFVDITPSKHSKGNKEKVKNVLVDFLNNQTYIPSGTYKDKQSKNIKSMLEKRFKTVTDWTQSPSQSPFDIHSIEVRVAIECKSGLVTLKKDGSYTISSNSVANATLYPSEVKVKDVVPKKDQVDYSQEVLESYMDVLVIFIDKCAETNNIVRYAIVDGNYWGHTNSIYKGSSKLLGVINKESFKTKLIDLIKNSTYDVDIHNTMNFYLNDQKRLSKFNLRKLLTVENPTKEC